MINPRLRMEQTGKGDRPEAGATRDRREGAGSRESPEQVCRLPLSSLHRPRPFGRAERDRQRQTADRQTWRAIPRGFLFSSHTIFLCNLPLHCS